MSIFHEHAAWQLPMDFATGHVSGLRRLGSQSRERTDGLDPNSSRGPQGPPTLQCQAPEPADRESEQYQEPPPSAGP